MIVFVLSIVKIIATLFLIVEDFLVIFSSPSILMLFVWTSDASSATFFAFKSEIWFVLFSVYSLVWLVTPWLTRSSRRVVKTVGVSFVLGFNLFDIICCMLTTFSIAEKMCNLVFGVLVICFSVWSIKTVNNTVGKVVDKETILLNPRKQ